MNGMAAWSPGQRALLRFLEREGLLAAVPDPPADGETPSDERLFALVADAVPPATLAELMALRLRVPLLDAENAVDPAVAALLPAAVASRRGTAPIGLRGEALEIATANPLDLDAVKDVEFASGRRARVFVTTRSIVEAMLAQLYGAPEDQSASPASGDVTAPAAPEEPAPTPDTEAEVAPSAPVADACDAPPASGRTPCIAVLAGDPSERARLAGLLAGADGGWTVVTAEDGAELGTMGAVVGPDAVVVGATGDPGALASEPLAARAILAGSDDPETLLARIRTHIDTVHGAESMETYAMTNDAMPAAGADRDALAALIARFSADRDAVTASVQRTDAAIGELAGRLDAVTQRAEGPTLADQVGTLRAEVDRLALALDAVHARAEQAADSGGDTAGAGGATDPASALDELRAEIGRTMADAVRRVTEETNVRVAQCTAEVQRALATIADAGGQAQQASPQTAAIERCGRELEALRAAMAQTRDEVHRRIAETEARLDVRVESIVAGAEAETRAVRESLLDQMMATDRGLQEVVGVITELRYEVPQAAAQAFDSVTSVHERIDQVAARLAALEKAHEGGVIDQLREQAMTAVATVISVGIVAGRFAVGLVR